jgi:transposase
MEKFSKYVGLDTHKETIAVSVADAAGGKARYFGDVANRPVAIRNLLKRLSPEGEVVSYCYEAGPCGYEVYRQITELGHDCMVVAPSLIPTRPGDRVKTDRRDSEALARLHRAGELTAVWVPDEEQEAMRDLTRAREDMKHLERQSKQRLNAFLLRHGRHYASGKSKWTQAHWRWLERVEFAQPVQQIVLQEYIDTIHTLTGRVIALETEMSTAVQAWSLYPVVEALMALRGCRLITAMTVMAELGDISRFDTPRQLMAFLGLVPSESSSGPNRRRGGITKTGNGHVRRLLIEAAWCYRFPARKSAPLQRRAEKTSAAVQAIAWKAQKRLCARFRYLDQRGMRRVKISTAIARELSGFMWAIACEVLTQRAPLSGQAPA